MIGRSPSPTRRHLGSRTALRRHRYDVWSPTPPDRVAAALAEVVDPERFSPLEGIARNGESYARERSVTIVARDGGRNPWHFAFRGSLGTSDGGTSLSGTVGPSSAVLVAVLVWMSIVALFFVSGVVAVVVDLISGQHTLVIPWLVIPALVLATSYALHWAAWSAAHERWRATDRWIRSVMGASSP